MAETAIARRYARALLELAREAEAIDRIGDDLVRLRDLLRAEGGRLRRAILHPAITMEERQRLLDALIARLDLHPLPARTIRLMQRRGRIRALDALVDIYLLEADRIQGRLRATLTTARPVSPELAEQVEDVLGTALHRDVVLSTRTDPDILGGLIIEAAGRVWDASVRTRLEDLRQELLHRAPLPEAPEPIQA